ncbi:35-cyclic nucleotide phosphodiesterase domain-containing protein, partial [Sesbania bispinosa]
MAVENDDLSPVRKEGQRKSTEVVGREIYVTVQRRRWTHRRRWTQISSQRWSGVGATCQQRVTTAKEAAIRRTSVASWTVRTVPQRWGEIRTVACGGYWVIERWLIEPWKVAL